MITELCGRPWLGAVPHVTWIVLPSRADPTKLGDGTEMGVYKQGANNDLQFYSLGNKGTIYEEAGVAQKSTWYGVD